MHRLATHPSCARWCTLDPTNDDIPLFHFASSLRRRNDLVNISGSSAGFQASAKGQGMRVGFESLSALPLPPSPLRQGDDDSFLLCFSLRADVRPSFFFFFASLLFSGATRGANARRIQVCLERWNCDLSRERKRD